MKLSKNSTILTPWGIASKIIVIMYCVSNKSREKAPDFWKDLAGKSTARIFESTILWISHKIYKKSRELLESHELSNIHKRGRFTVMEKRAKKHMYFEVIVVDLYVVIPVPLILEEYKNQAKIHWKSTQGTKNGISYKQWSYETNCKLDKLKSFLKFISTLDYSLIYASDRLYINANIFINRNDEENECDIIDFVENLIDA